MMGWSIRRTVDLHNQSPEPTAWRGNMMVAGDNNAHTWEVSVLRDREVISLDGGSATGYFRRDDGQTVVVPGEIEENVIRVTMPQACYAVKGPLIAVLRLAMDGDIITLAVEHFKISDEISNTLVDPGEVIPSLDALFAQISAMEMATDAANNAANAANNAITDLSASTVPTTEPGKSVQTKLDTHDSQLSAMIKNTNANLLDPASVVVGQAVSSVTGLPTANALCGFFTLDVTPEAYYVILANFTNIGTKGVGFDSEGSLLGSLFAEGVVYSQRVKPDNMGIMIWVGPNTTQLKINFSLDAGAVSDIFVFQDGYALSVDGGVSDEFGKEYTKARYSPLRYNLAPVVTKYPLWAYTVSTTGTFTYSEIFKMTPPFPVSAGEVYKVRDWLADGISPSSVSSRGQYYDDQFRRITNLPFSSDEEPTYTVPDGAAYMSIVYSTSMEDSLVIERQYDLAKDPKIWKDAIYPPVEALSTYWPDKKWASLGDSITYQGLWQAHVVNALGLLHTNCGIGSTCLAGASSTAFWQDARLDVVKAADPDLATILGGANDLAYGIPIGTADELSKPLADKDKGTFIGAYSYIVENLLAWKPSLCIVILTTTWAHMNGTDLSGTLTYDMYAAASKLVAEYYGLPCVDLYHECGFNAFTMDDAPYNVYSSDHIHPNAGGAKVMASPIIDTLLRIRQIA